MKHRFMVKIYIPDEDEKKLCEGDVLDWVYDTITETYEEIYDLEPQDAISVEEKK